MVCYNSFTLKSARLLPKYNIEWYASILKLPHHINDIRKRKNIRNGTVQNKLNLEVIGAGLPEKENPFF